MIVARFTPATGWAGRTITYDNGQFALEGYGRLDAQDVLRYDQQGQIAWDYDGLREWVGRVAAGAQHLAVNTLPSPPGIAVAGFVLAIAGFVFPVGVVWWVGLGLSWPGYAQAMREQLPTSLALAGLIINAVMTVVSVLFLLVVIFLVAVG